jgi:predicted nucleotidyltransferase
VSKACVWSAKGGRTYGGRWVAERIPASLLSALADLLAWLNGANVPSVIIGGVAASVLGRPRLTHDVDVLVTLPEASWGEVLARAASHAIVPRIGDAIEFAKRSRVLLLRHSPSTIDIDVTIAGLAFEHEVVARRESLDVAGVRIPFPRVEDLMVMKAIAHRAKDIEDLRGLLAAHPDADVAAVRNWIREFAVAAGMPDLLSEFDALLKLHR